MVYSVKHDSKIREYVKENNIVGKFPTQINEGMAKEIAVDAVVDRVRQHRKAPDQNGNIVIQYKNGYPPLSLKVGEDVVDVLKEIERKFDIKFSPQDEKKLDNFLEKTSCLDYEDIMYLNFYPTMSDAYEAYMNIVDFDAFYNEFSYCFIELDCGVIVSERPFS